MDYLSTKYIDLYNAAIYKIFESGTMTQIFGQGDTTDLIGSNKMIFKVKSFQEYNLVPSMQRYGFTREKAENEYNAMAQKRDDFVVFMQANFREITNNGVSGASTLQAITQNVTKFIGLMQVKPTFPRQGSITIEVTLHDIIDKSSSTSFDSDHCKSEKIFMAILLAIQMLHYPTPSPSNEYNLVFKFAKSLFGKSGLEKSSITCSRNRLTSALSDPVAANIFRLDTKELVNTTPKEAETQVSVSVSQPPELASSQVSPSDETLPDAAPVEEGQPDTMIGDELFEKMMKGEDPSLEEKDTYQKKVLQKFKQENYQVKNIKKWDFSSVREKLDEGDENRNEVLDLLLITPNGDVYHKLAYLVSIFGNSNCKDPDCIKIYLLTAGLLPYFHTQVGGSKSRRRNRCKLDRKTRRVRGRKSKSKSKAKTHRRRHHSRVRKHKKNTYTRRR